jgi:predicted MFS family arabinose efflux permease
MGNGKWPYLALAWACVPVAALCLFITAPLEKREIKREKRGRTFFSPYFLAACCAICAGGAAEIVLNQYASAYAELSLGFSKIASDLLGMCLFAVFLGFGRFLYGKLGKRVMLEKVMAISSLCAVAAYLAAGLIPVPAVSLVACALCGFAVALLWPGTLVVVSARFPFAGVWIFAVLAVCGDLGAGIGPAVTGFLADSLGLSAAITLSAVFPLIAFICHLFLYRAAKKKNSIPPLLHDLD